MTVTIADFNAGNLHSLEKALQRLGADTEITPDVERWLDAEVLVIPGDGAFAAMMEPIKGYRAALAERVKEGPTLGVCIGLQIAFAASAEDPDVPGLSVLDGMIERVPAERLPHMGWNTVHHDGSALFSDIPDEGYFYFVHSFGVLAHPEKSAQWGLQLLANFLKIAEDGTS